MTVLIVGIFGHATDVSLAIEDLKDLGIKLKKISVVTKQKKIVDQISHDTGIGKSDVGIGNDGVFGTARGIGTGLGMLPETAVAAGPAAHKLAGAELDESIIQGEGLAVGLMGLGIPKEDAVGYAKHAALENIILIVALENKELSQQISSLFNKHHAIPLQSV
ncbi:hypothetical protein [Paenibacillus wynnii]|uniref:hypothetical protein n=1 Tax=Paenibacillus wynnii TaxID=268407 RepID=UPI00068B4630|nr:hypothetical protein [Paenibacillus wynnii]